MNDLEVAILESLHALGGRAKIQEIYNHILRNHITMLQRSGEIARVTRGTYCLTNKGRRRIGVKQLDQLKPSKSAINSVEYWIDNEFGGVVTTQGDRIPTPREPIPGAKIAQRRPKNREMTTCPACRARVRVDRLEKHVRKVHPNWRGCVANQNPKSDSVSVDRGTECPEEELYQSDQESIYGDKYLGQMRRDYDGTFGSLPLYDDYGDESGPD